MWSTLERNKSIFKFELNKSIFKFEHDNFQQFYETTSDTFSVNNYTIHVKRYNSFIKMNIKCSKLDVKIS